MSNKESVKVITFADVNPEGPFTLNRPSTSIREEWEKWGGDLADDISDANRDAILAVIEENDSCERQGEEYVIPTPTDDINAGDPLAMNLDEDDDAVDEPENSTSGPPTPATRTRPTVSTPAHNTPRRSNYTPPPPTGKFN